MNLPRRNLLKLTGAAALASAFARGAGTDGFDLNALIQPVPEGAKFSDPEFNIWCGSMVRDDAGKCHLLYSRWPSKLGHLA